VLNNHKTVRMRRLSQGIKFLQNQWEQNWINYIITISGKTFDIVYGDQLRVSQRLAMHFHEHESYLRTLSQVMLHHSPQSLMF
jgi:hypothetical protein